VKVGARLYGTEPGALVELGVLAEELGYESLWRGDHVALPLRKDGSSLSEELPLRPSSPLLDSMMVFAFVASATTTIRFSVGVLIAPLRDPFLVARSALTLDRLSNGRFSLGLGAGWIEEEFVVMGKGFADRGGRMNEFVEVVRRLWSDPEPSYDGEWYRFDAIGFEPKPVARPSLPLFVGGESRAAMRRAAIYGDGWYGHAQPPSEIATRLDALRKFREESGRSGEAFEVTISVPVSVDSETVRIYRDLGVDRIMAEIGSVNLVDSRAVFDEFREFRERMDRWW
jgi:probable F420-dependent oxidoreductase